jgi:hypothetical protein
MPIDWNKWEMDDEIRQGREKMKKLDEMGWDGRMDG